jgi:hypothetical protein
MGKRDVYVKPTYPALARHGVDGGVGVLLHGVLLWLCVCGVVCG